MKINSVTHPNSVRFYCDRAFAARMAQEFQRLAASEDGDYPEFQTQELIEAERSGATVRAFRGINPLDLADLKELSSDDFDALFMVIEDSDF